MWLLFRPHVRISALNELTSMELNSVFCVCIAFCVFLFDLQADGASVVINPPLQVARLGEVVIFNCTVMGDISNESEFHIDVYLNDVKDEGNVVDSFCPSLSQCWYSLAIVAQSNVTTIVCTNTYGDNKNVSYLYLAETPSALEPTIQSLDAASLQLRWNEPASWPLTKDVLYYRLKMYNVTSGQWRDWVIPSRHHDNTTRIYDALALQMSWGVTADDRINVSVVISALYVPQRCEPLVFSISAGNIIGETESRSLRGFFRNDASWTPQALLLVPLCTADGIPCISATIIMPKLCDSQPFVCSILFNWTAGIHESLSLFDSSEGKINHLAKLDNAPLHVALNVTVLVTVTGSGGGHVAATSSAVLVGCGVSMEVADKELFPVPIFCSIYSVIPGCIFVLLCLLMSILIGVLAWKNRDEEKRSLRPMAPREERMNPLYTEGLEMVGHMYEHVGQYQRPTSDKKSD